MFGVPAWLAGIIVFGPPSVLAALVSAVLVLWLHWSSVWYWPIFLMLIVPFTVVWCFVYGFLTRVRKPTNNKGKAQNA